MKNNLYLSFFMLLIAIQGVYAQCTTPPVPAITSSGSTSICTGGSVTLSVTAPTYSTITTLAGSGVASYADGTGANAGFNIPVGMACDASGNVYVADYINHRIRKITPAGVATTFAGSGSQGFANGTGTAASFNSPSGLAFDSQGNLFVADQIDNRIRKITPAGVVTTFAGLGNQGFVNGNGTAASFNQPHALAFDAAGNLYVTDRFNHSIRKITTSGVVSTLAGNGSLGNANGSGATARFNEPHGIVCDASGNIFVADAQNNLIRKITATGVVTTFAGSGTAAFVDGTGIAASFNAPYGLTRDASGNLYVADHNNHRIRKITSTGVVTILAGSGNPTYADGNGTSSSFYYPHGIACDASGNLYVADKFNNRIRKITQNSYLWSNGATSTSITVSSAGTYTLRSISGTCTSAVSNSVVVSVNSTPSTPTITTSGTTTICNGSSVTLMPLQASVPFGVLVLPQHQS